MLVWLVGVLILFFLLVIVALVIGHLMMMMIEERSRVVALCATGWKRQAVGIFHE